ncbi:MAG: hypothetical protein ACLSG5_16330 [Oscillospiraceae bacterium]
MVKPLGHEQAEYLMAAVEQVVSRVFALLLILRCDIGGIPGMLLRSGSAVLIIGSGSLVHHYHCGYCQHYRCHSHNYCRYKWNIVGILFGAHSV